MYIQKVKELGERLRKQAFDEGFDTEDLVIVKRIEGSIDYELQLIEGSILKYLEDNYLR